MTIDEIMAVIDYNDFDVTFSGGDPMYHATELIVLAERIKHKMHDIWCYSGFTLEEIVADHDMRRLLGYIDVLVDGPFIDSRRKPGLLFRGSDNQRLIDVAATLKTGKTVEWTRSDIF